MQVIPTSWYVIVVLTLALLVTSCGWSGSNKALVKERAAHAADVRLFKDAQVEANRKAETKRVELNKKAEKNAKSADDKYNVLLAEYRTNLLRFKANQSGGKRSYSGDIQPTESGNRPSASSNIPNASSVGSGTITITMGDAQICAVNTARLQAVREWALDPPH